MMIGFLRLRRCLTSACLVTGVAVAAAGRAQAIQDAVTQVPITVPFKIPSQVAELMLVDSAVVGTALAFSYKGEKVTRLDVFVYALPSGDTSQSDVRASLLNEVQSFKQSLPIAVARGWYDDYRLAFDTEKPVRAGEQIIPGYSAAVVVARGRQSYLSMFYIYALGGMLVKIRLTVPEPGWDTNPALGFPEQFIQRVAPAH